MKRLWNNISDTYRCLILAILVLFLTLGTVHIMYLRHLKSDAPIDNSNGNYESGNNTQEHAGEYAVYESDTEGYSGSDSKIYNSELTQDNSTGDSRTANDLTIYSDHIKLRGIIPRRVFGTDESGLGGQYSPETKREDVSALCYYEAVPDPRSSRNRMMATQRLRIIDNASGRVIGDFAIPPHAKLLFSRNSRKVYVFTRTKLRICNYSGGLISECNLPAIGCNEVKLLDDNSIVARPRHGASHSTELMCMNIAGRIMWNKIFNVSHLVNYEVLANGRYIFVETRSPLVYQVHLLSRHGRVLKTFESNAADYSYGCSSDNGRYFVLKKLLGQSPLDYQLSVYDINGLDSVLHRLTVNGVGTTRISNNGKYLIASVFQNDGGPLLINTYSTDGKLLATFNTFSTERTQSNLMNYQFVINSRTIEIRTPEKLVTLEMRGEAQT